MSTVDVLTWAISVPSYYGDVNSPSIRRILKLIVDSVSKISKTLSVTSCYIFYRYCNKSITSSEQHLMSALLHQLRLHLVINTISRD